MPEDRPTDLDYLLQGPPARDEVHARGDARAGVALQRTLQSATSPPETAY